MERDPDGACLHDEQHNQRAGAECQCRPAAAVCNHALTTAVRFPLLPPKPARQSGGALAPSHYSTKTVLFTSHCLSQVLPVLKLQHHGERCRQRAAAPRRHPVLLQAVGAGTRRRRAIAFHQPVVLTTVGVSGAK